MKINITGWKVATTRWHETLVKLLPGGLWLNCSESAQLRSSVKLPAQCFQIGLRLDTVQFLYFGVDDVLPNVGDWWIRGDWKSTKFQVSTSTDPNARRIWCRVGSRQASRNITLLNVWSLPYFGGTTRQPDIRCYRPYLNKKYIDNTSTIGCTLNTPFTKSR